MGLSVGYKVGHSVGVGVVAHSSPFQAGLLVGDLVVAHSSPPHAGDLVGVSVLLGVVFELCVSLYAINDIIRNVLAPCPTK